MHAHFNANTSPSTRSASAVVSIEFFRGDRHQNFLVLVKFEKQTDGTRRRKLRANPDVESRFSKNNYTFNNNIPDYEQGAAEWPVKLTAR